MFDDQTTEAPRATAVGVLRTVRRLSRYLAGYRWLLVVALLLVLAASVLSTYPVVVIRRIIDTVAQQSPGGLSLLLRWCVLYLLLHLGAVVANRTLALISALLEGELGHRIRSDAFDHVQALSLNFYESHKTGETLSKLIGDAEMTVQGFLAPATSFIRTFSTLVLSVLFMAAMDLRLTAVAFPAGVLAGAAMVFFGRLLRDRQRTAREAADRLWSGLIESLEGMRDIQANNQQTRVSQWIREASEAVRARTMDVNRVQAASGALNDAIFVAVIATVLMLGGYMAYRGTITYGILIAFMMYAHMLVDPLANVASLYWQWQRIIVSAERIFDIFDHVPVIRDRPDGIDATAVRGSIEFRNVSFDYGADRDVLRGVSFSIPAGQKVALVGPSGGGKTTIVKLIARFYDPAAGEIRVGGTDLRNITLASWRSNVGILFQDIFLFDDSLATNIRLGRPDATDSEVERAAVQAGLGEFLSLHRGGLNLRVGQNGVKLSGGERQRVALARVLLKDPSIIILDEPASALDAVTTSELLRRLSYLLAGRTVIIIAHQLASVIDADMILMLEDGRVVEQGRHEELAARAGAYAFMYEAQFPHLPSRHEVIPASE